MKHIFQAARNHTVPPAIYKLYSDNRQLQVVAIVCLLLQKEVGDNPFPLPCRAIGKYFDIGPAHAGTLRKHLQADGVIRCVHQGGLLHDVRVPNLYRYLLADEQEIA